MSITLTLKVTIDGFSDEASDRGNFSARGITAEVLEIKGCEATQLSTWAPKGGNGGGIAFLTKDKGLAAKINKARDARGSGSDELVRLQARIAELEAAAAGKVAKKPISPAAALKAKIAALEAAAK